ncbi:MAG: polysaccharide biosynthesis tyrosine autokinase [Desulfovibrionales bacterium]
MSKIGRALDHADLSLEESTGNVRHIPWSEEEETPEPYEKKVVYTRTQVVPRRDDHLEKNRIMSHLDDLSVVDHYNLLRTQILQRTRESGRNSIMITSVNPGEGKTVTAINLAISISREIRQTALLVDMNLRNPKVSEYMNLEKGRGVANYLMGEEAVSDLLVNPDLAKMVVFPSGKPITGSTEILGSPRMAQLVRELKNRYEDRYVIYDCPHILNMPDSLVFSSYVDGVVLVVEAGKTSLDDVHRAVQLLDKDKVIGIVMNKARKAA